MRALASTLCGRAPAFCFAALLQLRQVLLRLADAVVPARLSLYELTAGVAHTHIVAALASLGIPQALSRRSQSVAALATTLGVATEPLLQLLRVAAALGLVTKRRNDCFAANRRTRALCPNRWGSMAPFAVYMASEANVMAWAQLPQLLRGKGDAFVHRFGYGVWDFFNKNPTDAAIFGDAMTALTQSDAPLIARAFAFGRFGCICEVGGGHGALLIEILRQNPQARGILCDSPEVLARAASYAPRQLVASRLTDSPGNFFKAVPAGADLYVLRHVLHDWDDASCTAILSNCRNAMRPGQPLLVIETRLEPNAVDSLSAMKDLTMALLCGGRERGRVQMQRLLADSGFCLQRLWPVWAPVALWEAYAV